MDIDQVNQLVAELHFEIYNRARQEGKGITDAFQIAECLIQSIKGQTQDANSLSAASLPTRMMGLLHNH